jgi:hypothetical protein
LRTKAISIVEGKMRVFQMAGEEKMDDWDELDPDAYWGWVGLEWVRGIGETLAVRISIHYKIALLVYLSAHSTTCKDQEFASHKMMSSFLHQHL